MKNIEFAAPAAAITAALLQRYPAGVDVKPAEAAALFIEVVQALKSADASAKGGSAGVLG